LECKYPPPEPNTCAGQIKTITNPSQNFEVLCNSYAGCAGATINVELPANGLYIEALKGFFFTHEWAGSGAIININNQRGADVLIEEVKCIKLGSCHNTQFILGANVQIEVGDFFCGLGSCDGCVVRQTAAGPPVPCYAFVEPI